MSLLRVPRADHAAGFEDFVARRAAPMLAMARGLVRREQDAEDLVQDVLATALLKWHRVSSADDPAAYVNRMLVNAAMSWWRRPARREHPSADGALAVDGTLDDPSTAAGERAAVLAALRRLPIKHRAVLVLRYYEGMPDHEIAGVLSMAPSTVRSSARRGLAALRAAGDLGEGGAVRRWTEPAGNPSTGGGVTGA